MPFIHNDAKLISYSFIFKIKNNEQNARIPSIFLIKTYVLLWFWISKLKYKKHWFKAVQDLRRFSMIHNQCKHGNWSKHRY